MKKIAFSYLFFALSFSVQVKAQCPPTPTVSAAPSANCLDREGTITISAPLGAGLTYSIDGVSYFSTPIFTDVEPGTYNVTAKNSVGCVSPSAIATVDPPAGAPPNPTVTVADPLCGQTTGTITVNSPTGAGFSYTSDGTDFSNTSGIFTSVPPGTYTIMAKNASGCISGGTSVTIASAPTPAPAPTTTLTQPTCAVPTGTITVTVPAPGAGISYSIDGTTYTNTTGVFSGLAPGPYSVTVRNTGCTSTASSVTINAVPPTVTPTFTQIGPLCQNSTAPALPTSSTNGVNGTWSPATINTATAGSTTYTFTPSTGQCGTTATMTIVVNAPPTPTFTQIGPLCQNSTAPTLPTSSTNGVNGTWSPATINTATAGSTTYTFTPSTGQCGTTATMTIVVNAPPTPTFTQIGPLCQNSTAPALPTSSTNGVNGTWSPATINTATAGSTTYTFTPSTGQCGTTATMTIVVNAAPTPTFTQIGPLFKYNSTCITHFIQQWRDWYMESGNHQYGNSRIHYLYIHSINRSMRNNSNNDHCCECCTNTNIHPDRTFVSKFNSTCIAHFINKWMTGTWSPATINTATAGSTTYTFTPSTGQCGTTATMTIVVNAAATPTFTQIGPLCQNSTAPALPTASNNSITGTWSPATINTATPDPLLIHSLRQPVSAQQQQQ